MPSIRILAVVLLTSLVSGLAACGGSSSDLKQQLDTLRQRPGGRIEPLPAIRSYEAFVYEPNHVRSPFTPGTPVVAPGAGGVRPDSHRNREFLEGFSLDTLRMVGTLRQAGHVFGLVLSKDGLIHRVQVGNYLGQNDGRVTTVTESKITVAEIVPDGLGGYMERQAAVTLATN
jgi:type IV pilus assembly protein PilP